MANASRLAPNVLCLASNAPCLTPYSIIHLPFLNSLIRLFRLFDCSFSPFAGSPHSPVRPFADSIISADNSHFLCDYKPSTCNASHLNHYTSVSHYRSASRYVPFNQTFHILNGNLQDLRFSVQNIDIAGLGPHYTNLSGRGMRKLSYTLPFRWILTLKLSRPKIKRGKLV